MSNFYIRDEDIEHICNQVLVYIKSKSSNSYTDMVKDIISKYVRSGNMSEKQRAIVARLYFVYIYNWKEDSFKRQEPIDVYNLMNTTFDDDLPLDFK